MRVVDVSHWGFLLEHDDMPFFVPTLAPGTVKFQHRVQLAEDFGVVIQTGDLPFYVDRQRTCHFIKKESLFGELIMRTMIAYISGQ